MSSNATFQTQSGDRIAYDFVGLTILDYFDLYQKFTYVNQESYKLDHIAFIELGEKKVEYEYDHFKDFYTKDFQKFVEYNYQDVKLVQKLETETWANGVGDGTGIQCQGQSW